jgi:hypothetical protein
MLAKKPHRGRLFAPGWSARRDIESVVVAASEDGLEEILLEPLKGRGSE